MFAAHKILYVFLGCICLYLLVVTVFLSIYSLSFFDRSPEHRATQRDSATAETIFQYAPLSFLLIGWF